MHSAVLKKLGIELTLVCLLSKSQQQNNNNNNGVHLYCAFTDIAQSAYIHIIIPGRPIPFYELVHLNMTHL